MGKKHHRHDNPEVKSQQTPRGTNKEEYGLEFSDVNASKQFEIAAAQKYAKAEKAKREGARRNSK
ncbi:hypothetical protein ACNQFZ_04350 [Schinkia sp. CFF1]